MSTFNALWPYIGPLLLLATWAGVFGLVVRLFSEDD